MRRVLVPYKADPGARLGAPGDDPFQAIERSPADEQDVRGVDLDELLLRVLAPSLRRHVGDRAFEDLEQGLLHSFARHVSRDGGIGACLAPDLVDLVDVDDPLFGSGNVIVGSLDQPQEDVFHVLAHVSGFCEGGGIRDRKGHVEEAGECLCEQGLAAPRRPDEQDIALGQFDLVGLTGGHNALVVIVDRHREHALGLRLADDVFVQVRGDLFGRGQSFQNKGLLLSLRRVLQQDLGTEVNALVADVYALRPGDQLADLVASAVAERTPGYVVRIRHHPVPVLLSIPPSAPGQ